MKNLNLLPTDRILVSPSVLAADFTELAAEIDRAVQGKADLIHLDVMDGCFVPNISFGPPVIKSIRKRTELILDTHIMIEHPVRYAKAFAEAGSDHLTFHLECADPTAEAIEAIRQGADKIRINPGNIGAKERVQAVVDKAKEYNVPIRVGVNSGSLEKHLLEKYGGVTAEGIVESALDKVHLIESMGYDNLVVSIKSSDVLMCVKAHELIAKECPYPLHVGITESGTVYSGNVKSSVGLGIILHEGIGNTIRVSLTGDPVEEIRTAKLILKTLGLRKGGIEVVSCPTCGRTRIDLIKLANQVEEMVADIPLDIKVAVMGCVVNGPGEAKEADIGIAGGIGEGLLIKKGEIIKKVKEEELLDTLRQELLNWNK